MEIIDSLNGILGDQLGPLTVGLFVVAFLRFALGAFAALRDETFVLSSVGAFIRSQILGRVFPILTTAFLAGAIEGEAGVALTLFAAGQGATYVAESIGAIREALSPVAAIETASKEVRALELGNAVPQD
jgi:hypothetical protein